jgi:hypothetical protein
LARTGGASYLARLGILYAHPIRMKIQTELYRREMGPTQWREEYGGSSYGMVLGHFRALEKHGWLRKVRNPKAAGRGRSRDLYRATELPVIDDDTWAELPTSIQIAFTARCLRLLGERIGGALARGAVDATPAGDRLFTCRSVGLDDRGWQEAMSYLSECFFSLTYEQQDAKVRLRDDPEPGVLVTIALAGFESPRAGRKTESDVAGGREADPLQLSDDGELPLSTRMAKVFGNSLNMEILNALHHEVLSPTQLKANLEAEESLQAIDRKCQTLTELGWLLRLGAASDPPPVFYKAAGPEAFDADLWGGIPAAAHETESWPVFDHFCRKAEEALRQGSFNARQDRHVTFCTFLLDDRGRQQVSLALEHCNDQLRKVERDARQRAGQRIPPPYAATFLLARFEDPEADCDC